MTCKTLSHNTITVPFRRTPATHPAFTMIIIIPVLFLLYEIQEHHGLDPPAVAGYQIQAATARLWNVDRVAL